MDIDMELLPRFAGKIRDKAREEGLSQGHQQGIREGQRQTVAHLLTVRFGPLPDEAVMSWVAGPEFYATRERLPKYLELKADYQFAQSTRRISVPEHWRSA